MSAAALGLVSLTIAAPIHAQERQGSPTAPSVERAGSDHDRVHVGSFAVGFQGTRFVPGALPHPVEAVTITPEGGARVTIVPSEVTVPLFGPRYWFTDFIGIDLGIGFNVASGSQVREIPNPDPTLDQRQESSTPSTTAVAARVGLPLSVFDVSHFNFMIIPELDLGYSAISYEAFDVSTGGEALDLRLDGLLVGAGLRAGAEVSLGFFDVPQLSLQAAFGLRFEHRRRSGRIGDAKMALTENEFGTSSYGAPWDVFTGSIALLYYFGPGSE
jgi:hypothetical protein